MKRWEKLSKEEIMYLINPSNAEICEIVGESNRCKSGGYECLECIYEYLNKEIEMIPRCHTCKTEKDFEKLYNEFLDNHKGFFQHPELYSYMMEKVEVEK